MSKTAKTIIMLLFAAFTLNGVATGGIVRVAKRYNVVDLCGGYSTPVGSYDGLSGFLDFTDEGGRAVDIDADRLYDPTFHIGLNYGQLRNNRMLISVGFRYTRIDQLNLYQVTTTDLGLDPTQYAQWEANSMFMEKDKPSLSQYDFDFNFSYLFTPISENFWSPYVGLGVRGGLTAATHKGFESESHLNAALAASCGVEVKVWESPRKRSFATLASVNSYDLLESGNRPRFLNFGLGLKYYFRP